MKRAACQKAIDEWPKSCGDRPNKDELLNNWKQTLATINRYIDMVTRTKETYKN